MKFLENVAKDKTPTNHGNLHRPSYVRVVAKRLNGFGWSLALGMYTAGVVLVTLHYQNADVNRGQNALPREMAAIKEELNSIKENALINRELEKRRLRSYEGKIAMLREDLLRETQAIGERYLELAKRKEVKPEKSSRPMRVNLPSKSKTLAFNEVNMDVLRKKQALELKELKAYQSEEKKKFLETADLSDPQQKSQWKKMQTRFELNLERMRSTHNETLNKFRRQEYLLVEN